MFFIKPYGIKYKDSKKKKKIQYKYFLVVNFVLCNFGATNVDTPMNGFIS